MERRQVKNPQVLSLIALIPLFGSLIYLCVRPPLTETVLGVTSNPNPVAV